MPSFKSDSSFFYKIAMGAVGTRAVKADLAEYGHKVVELERGSLEAKIWKGVKRKRVRIPDLVCVCCGQRIEVRTKSETKISMSHSPTIPERRWDYGMVGQDLISIPICTEDENGAFSNGHWMRGTLAGDASFWSEKEWVKWLPDGAINYFPVSSFRAAPPDKTQTKGAEEGAETTLIWRSCFSPSDGTVIDITAANITVKNKEGARIRRGCKDLPVLVKLGEKVSQNQILACKVTPTTGKKLKCGGGLTAKGISDMLGSQHLPVRFAGVKLARVLAEKSLHKEIAAIAANDDEDIYIRLEAKAYMAAVCALDVKKLFEQDLAAMDKADQLEAVIAIGEVGTESAASLLALILGNQSESYFLRSAAAYCLGRIDSEISRTALVQAFTAQTHRVREDALLALADVGFGAIPALLAGVDNSDEQIQAGCAEVLRLLALRSDERSVEQQIVPPVAEILARDNRSLMAVWLGGHLPEPLMRAALNEVLNRDSRLAYSLAVSWAFAKSWIAPLYDTLQSPSQ